MTAVLGQPYVRVTGTDFFEAHGREDVLGDPPNRDELELGEYRPGPETTGPVPGIPLTPFTPPGGPGTVWVITSDVAATFPLVDGKRQIAGLDIDGSVRLTVPNVRLKNNRIRTPYNVAKIAGTWNACVDVQPTTAAGFHVVDCELFSVNPYEQVLGVYGSAGGVVERCNIHHLVDGGRTWGSGIDILGNWIHDLLHFGPNPPFSPTNGSHDDGWQFPPASYFGPINVIGNDIDATQAQIPGDGNTGPACLMIDQTVMDLTVHKNWITWGCWPINAGGIPNSAASLVITDNVIAPGWHLSGNPPTSGHIIASAAWRALWVQTGNTDMATGGAIRVKNG